MRKVNEWIDGNFFFCAANINLLNACTLKTKVGVKFNIVFICYLFKKFSSPQTKHCSCLAEKKKGILISFPQKKTRLIDSHVAIVKKRRTDLTPSSVTTKEKLISALKQKQKKFFFLPFHANKTSMTFRTSQDLVSLRSSHPYCLSFCWQFLAANRNTHTYRKKREKVRI